MDLLTMPLSDCTYAALQALNRANNTTPAAKPAVRTTRINNPYGHRLLAPEDSVEHNVLLCSPASYYSSSMALSPDGMPDQTSLRAYHGCLGLPNLAGEIPFLAADQHTVPSHGNVSRTLFCKSWNATASQRLQPTSTNTSTSQESVSASTNATPMKNVGRIYVDGRPMPVRRHCYVEVLVALHDSNVKFAIPDIYSMFPPDVDTSDLVGRYVIVEGDRGEDMGCIHSVESTQTYSDANEVTDVSDAVSTSKPQSSQLLKVLRAANALEMQQYEELPAKEEEALAFCRSCLTQAQLTTPISVEAAIFQFDRKKLTFHYTSDSYVDFNVLTRLLHDKYKCRIWMHQMNREQHRFTEQRRGKRECRRHTVRGTQRTAAGQRREAESKS